MRCWVLVTLLAGGCAIAGGDDANESFVVGGQPESGYPPVGYLRNNLYYPQYKTWCGVTLIAPKVVITAAHCVDGIAAGNLAVGFGQVDSSPTVAVTAVHKHTSYVYRAEGDFLPWDDIAILELAQEVSIPPATLARATTGTCTNRYVGYGRNVPGGGGITMGYDGQRRSARICIDAENPHELYIHGADGGLCWGDSGGPLLADGSTRVFGVLSRHAPRANSQYSCEDGNRMIFTAAATYHDFITQYAPNAFEPEAPSTTTVGWCNVQWPETLAARPYATTEAIFGRVWVDGVTGGHGQGAGVLAEVGFGPNGSAPDTAPGWIWYGAQYNVDADGLSPGDLANDEYMGTVFPYAAGTYSLAYRFSVDRGTTWKTCPSGSKLTVAP
jgi:secreted trypsin-like serine protease